MKEQLDLAREKAVSLEAASSKNVVQFKEELARLQMECDLSRTYMMSAGSAGTVLHRELEVVTALVRDLKLGKETLRKKFETSSKTHGKTEAQLVQDLRETCDNLGIKIRECDVLRAKVGKLEKGLATLCDALKVNEMKIEVLKCQ